MFFLVETRESLRDNLNNRKIYPSTRCSLLGTPRTYFRAEADQNQALPCGGGVEYLHRDPASRRRRRKRESQIWDSKIRSLVPRDSDPRKTALARSSSIYKRQARPLFREGAPQKQDRNSQIVIYIWSWAPDGVRHQDLLTDWPSVAMWLQFQLELQSSYR
jgi:hypothetical protein